MKTEDQLFGDALRQALASLNCSARKFATAVGVTPATVGRWLSGAHVPDEMHQRAIERTLERLAAEDKT